MEDKLDEKLTSALESAVPDSSFEAEWTKATVARRLLGVLAEPAKIGRFSIVRFIGSGAMGRVFLAYDEQLQREVAVKLLAGHRSDAARQRMVQEARALARLSHPNVVQVYEVGIQRGEPFIAMEFLRGSTIRQWQQNESPPPRRVLDAYLQAGAGLKAAHDEGLVHRDFKPDNVFIHHGAEALRVRVIDFGLARAQHGFDSIATQSESRSGTTITRTGTLLGTPIYMAPEQLRGERGTASADQFAFCVAVAEALWGRHPFASTSLDALKAAHESPPTFPKGAGSELSWVKPILARGMAANPQDRFPSLDALLKGLAQDPVRRRRRNLALGSGAAALVIIGAAAGNLSNGKDPCSGAAQAFGNTWSGERRKTLERAFEALEANYVSRTWIRVDASLGAFVGEWVDGHTDACVATNIRGEQSSELMDRRMLCLDRARREFEALLDVLETQTSDIVDYADDVLDGLPDLDVCAAPDQLDAYQRPPASAQKAAVERARALVAKSEALRRAGRSVLSLEKAEEAEAAVSGLEYDPIEAEVQLALGRALEDAGKPVEAARALGAAVEAATRSGLNRVRRNALAARYTVEAEQGHFDAADVLEPGVIGGSKSPTDVADVKVRRAGALVLRGQAAKATEEFRAALSILEPLADPLAIARARRGLATSLVGQARFAEAEVEARRVIEILAEHLGSQHPRGAGAYGTLADILRQAGRYDDAEVEARRALAQTEAVRQGGHPDIAAARRTLGSLLWSAGKYDDALEALRTSAEETEAAYGPNHIATASAYNNLAGPLSSLGRIDDALVALRKALNIKQSTLGENHPSTARTRDNVAGLLREQGKFDEAELEHRAAMQARIAAFGSIHPEVAISHSSLGTLFQFQGKLEQAEMAYAKAVHIATESEGPDHPDVAHYQVNQANMPVELGQLEEAIVLLRKAVATRTAKLAPGTARLLDSHNALGRALCRSGQRTEGRAQLETSLATPLSGSVILQVRYEAAFELAKCAWDDHDRTRSDAAVASAREWADKDGPTAAAFTKGVEAWVASRR